MKFAVSWNSAALGTDPEALVRFAQRAEALGFEALHVPEHLAVPQGSTIYGTELKPTLTFLDPLETLAFVAASTSRLLLGTGALLLPHHHPVHLAKRLATLDVLSAGRLRFVTVGVGAIPGEAAAVGVDFRSRGRRADEAIDVLRLLWSGDPDGVSHDGEFFAFPTLSCFPLPVGGQLPLHIAGSSAAAARRAGARGDGWFAGGQLTPQQRAEQREVARAAAVAAGRDPDALQYTRWGHADLTPDDVATLAAQGVDRLVLPALTPDPSTLDPFALRHHLP